MILRGYFEQVSDKKQQLARLEKEMASMSQKLSELAGRRATLATQQQELRKRMCIAIRW